MLVELQWALGLFTGVVVVAALVNLLAKLNRSRLRRVVILYTIYLAAFATFVLLHETGASAEWIDRACITTEVLRVIVLVNVAGTLLFSVLLPLVRISTPMIARDLVVGVGYIVTTLVILAHHGLNPTSIFASAAVVSAVLAISLQTTLGNILGGVALQLDGSIHEGDWIQLENGKQGKVRAIRWRHTLVETRDWSTIVVPNSQLLANNITILGWREGAMTTQRMWVWFNVDYRYSPTTVIQTITDALLLSPIENVAENPTPNCVCMDFTKDGRESVASYAVRYWIKDLAADDPTNSRVRARIFTALQRACIPLAMPANTTFVELHDQARQQRHDANSLEKHLAALKTVHIFRSLSEDELRTLAGGMSHVLYTAGEYITHQGAVAHWLYVITSGSAEIRTRIDPDGAGPLPEVTRTVATVKAPDFFGEMGLMTGEARFADVVALTDIEGFRLGKATFQQVLLARPEIANELSEKLANRRVELLAVRDGLDTDSLAAHRESERARILGAIKQFFGL